MDSQDSFPATPSTLVCDLQTKLNHTRAACGCYRTKTAGQDTGTPRTSGRDKRRLQSRTEHVARRQEDMAVENVEEGSLKVNNRLLSYDVCFLADGEVLILCSKATCGGQRAGLVSKCTHRPGRCGCRAVRCRGKSSGIPKWR